MQHFSLADIQTMNLTQKRVRTFVQICRALALGDLRQDAASIAAAAGDREASEIIKAQVGAGTLSELPEFEAVSAAFVASLRNSAFDAALPSMVRVPRQVLTGLITQIAAEAVAEGRAKTVQSLSLVPGAISPLKSAVIVVASRELLEAPDFPLSTLETELRNGVASTTDANFLSVLTAGAPTVAAGNSNPAADLASLFALVPRGATSRPFFIGGVDVRDKIPLLEQPLGDNGGPSPISGPGGRVLNIPFATSDAIAPDSLLLADLSRIAAWDEAIELSRAAHASIEMDTVSTGASDTPTATNLVSLWQTNSVAIRVERRIGARKIDANAAGILTGINWLAAA